MYIEYIDMDEAELSHEELMKITTTAINELLKEDSFLSDLPKAVTLEEVNNQIALQYGKSITVNVLRGDGEKMPVVVSITMKTLRNGRNWTRDS